jgi:hypothetical protein
MKDSIFGKVKIPVLVTIFFIILGIILILVPYIP